MDTLKNKTIKEMREELEELDDRRFKIQEEIEIRLVKSLEKIFNKKINFIRPLESDSSSVTLSYDFSEKERVEVTFREEDYKVLYLDFKNLPTEDEEKLKELDQF